MATRSGATVEDVLRLAAAGERFELVDGELVEMAPTGFEHGDVELHVGALLRAHADGSGLGKVVVGEVLFLLDRARGLARAADVAFVRSARLPAGRERRGAFAGAPDLAVEIVSPANSAGEMQRRVDEWLAAGTTIVLVLHPDERVVVAWRDGRAVALRGEDVVDLEAALPGFRCRARDLFPPDDEGS